MPGFAGVKIHLQGASLPDDGPAVQVLGCAGSGGGQRADKALSVIGKIGGQKPVTPAGQGAQHGQAAGRAAYDGQRLTRRPNLPPTRRKQASRLPAKLPASAH